MDMLDFNPVFQGSQLGTSPHKDQIWALLKYTTIGHITTMVHMYTYFKNPNFKIMVTTLQSMQTFGKEDTPKTENINLPLNSSYACSSLYCIEYNI